MSTIFAEPIATIAPEREVRSYARIHVRPGRHEEPLSDGRLEPKPATRSAKPSQNAVGTDEMVTGFAARGVLFSVLVGIGWVASSVSGHVFADAARDSGIRAHQRAEIAEKALASLQTRVDALTSDDGVEAWARAHGMVNLDGFDNGDSHENKGLVAINR